MRNALVWTLTALGFLALLFGLSYSWTGSVDETVTRIGFPDAWYEKTTQANRSSTTIVNLMKWSFGFVAVGVFALGAAVKISWKPKPIAAKA